MVVSSMVTNLLASCRVALDRHEAECPVPYRPAERHRRIASGYTGPWGRSRGAGRIETLEVPAEFRLSSLK